MGFSSELQSQIPGVDSAYDPLTLASALLLSSLLL